MNEYYALKYLYYINYIPLSSKVHNTFSIISQT